MRQFGTSAPISGRPKGASLFSFPSPPPPPKGKIKWEWKGVGGGGWGGNNKQNFLLLTGAFFGAFLLWLGPFFTKIIWAPYGGFDVACVYIIH